MTEQGVPPPLPLTAAPTHADKATPIQAAIPLITIAFAEDGQYS
jgi:hypothetical protein